MLVVLLFLAALTAGATTTVTVTSVTAQQIVLRMVTDQTGACTVEVSESPTYLPLAHDVNATLFSGANNCSRPGNIQNGREFSLVIGKRTAELSASDNRKYSRSLFAGTTYFIRIVSGSDTVTLVQRTSDLRFGNTHNESKADRSRPGEYLYPSIRWDDKTVAYADPHTGARVRLVGAPGELFPRTLSGLTFADFESSSGSWTITGLSASFDGTGQPWMYMRVNNPGTTVNDLTSPDYVQLVATLSGTAPNAEVALTLNGATPLGLTLSQSITGTPTSKTFGTTTPILESWRSGPEPPINMDGFRRHAGTVSKSGTAITWVSGDLFKIEWGGGLAIIRLGGTDCQISSVTHEKLLVLTNSSCVADSGSIAYTADNFGFLIRSSTTASSTLVVAVDPTWTLKHTGQALSVSQGSTQLCSPVKANGGLGHLCSFSESAEVSRSGNPVYYIPDDGSGPRLIALSFAPVGASGLDNANCSGGDGLIWDQTVAARWWCRGATGGGANPVVYSITYTGDYSAITPAVDAQCTCTAANVSTNIRTQANTFTNGDTPKMADFAANCAWNIEGPIGSDRLLLRCWETFQNTMAWLISYRISTASVDGAVSTYGGAAGKANRWGIYHSGFVAYGSDYVYSTIGYATQSGFSGGWRTQVTSGTLTSADPVSATVTVSTLTPVNTAAQSAYGSTLAVGDNLAVCVNDNNDCEDDEVVKITAIVGSNLTVDRVQQTWRFGSNLSHTGTLWLRPVIAGSEMWWNPVLDPHGTAAVANSLFMDPDTSDCHQVFGGDIFLAGCYQINALTGLGVRAGAVPANFTGAKFGSNWDAFFAGSVFTISTTYNQSHPSIGFSASSGPNRQRYNEQRPYLCDNSTGTPTVQANVSNVSGQLYLVGSTGTGNLRPKLQPILATSGDRVFIDVSPAVLATTSVDDGKFCHVNIANDCRSGSTVGQIYVNASSVAQAYAAALQFAAWPGSAMRDICIVESTHTANTIMDGLAPSADPSGRFIRRLTTGFARMKIQNTFWNGRALADGSRYITHIAMLGNARSELILVDLPPAGMTDATPRNGFVSIPVTVSAMTGANQIRARMGYAENGDPTNFYCTPRQVACVTDGTTSPFVWTDEALAPQSCTSGTCTVNIPALPGRVLYYQIERLQSGTLVSTGPTVPVGVN